MSNKEPLATLSSHLSTEILDILPNPVLVKNDALEYVWINRAFEQLFSVKRENVVGKLDAELFPDRQVAQCNGGDMRVLNDGEIDEAVETVFENSGRARETITRKSRLDLGEGEVYLVGVMHDITEVTRANEALEESRQLLEDQAVELVKLATTDALTGCGNRRHLQQCEDSLLSVAERSVALLGMDIDRFKAINDSQGHDCGDAVLKHFASLIRSHISDSDYFIRLGGEEFVVSLSGVSAAESLSKADAIRQAIEDTPFIYKGDRIPYTVSVGVAFKEVGETATMEAMLKTADANLYRAKVSGRNRVVLAA